MPDYLVVWNIEVEDVDSPRAAAEKAWEHMRRPGSTANVFDVIDANGVATTVDLEESED